MSCLEFKIEHLAPFSILTRCSLHVFCICSLYSPSLFTLYDIRCQISLIPHVRGLIVQSQCVRVGSFSFACFGVYENKGHLEYWAYFPEWALEFWSCESSPISYWLSAIINHPPQCFSIETRPFLSDDIAPSDGSLPLSETHQYGPPLGHWQIAFLVHPASSSSFRKDRRTTNFTRRRPHSADYLIPIQILSLDTVHNALALIAQLQLLTLVSYSGFLLGFMLAPATCSSCCMCSRGIMLWGCVYTSCACLWNSYRCWKVLRLSLPHAGWGKMPICHAASLLEHRCSLIQHGNLAVLPRGERSKQNDTLGYRANLTVLYVDINVMYGYGYSFH